MTIAAGVPSRLAGGASSPVRAGAAVGGAPFVQASGRGAFAYDDAGREYVDYLLAYGPLLFGHAHPALVTGLDALAARGSVFGSTHRDELRLAERLGRLLPSLERLRFVSTGTEAMMSAVRVARAATGRTLVARFAGNYHGHFDGALHDAGASAKTSDAARNVLYISRFETAGSAATALSTSDASAIATLPVTSPEAGLNTSPNMPLVPATCLPPMKWPISRMVWILPRFAKRE